MIKSLLLAFCLVMLPAQAATVTVTVHKVKKAEGDIRAALCADEASYKADTCIAEAIVKAKAGSTTLDFKNVAPGTYGIQLMHDKNGNGDMDFNFLGLPKEGYGFSNNAKPRLSQPSFSKIAFIVGQNDVQLSINLIN
jgi:uncharacterized protein (DUF2141 family)